jgi:ATP-dependent helicase/nuclease subunit B
MRVPRFGVDPLERGNITHDALELMFNEIGSRGGLDRLDGDTLDELIASSSEAAMRKHFAGRGAFGRVSLDIEEERLRKLMTKLVEFDRERVPFVVEATEESADVAIGPLQLKLRHDRVDRLDTGARLVIDYKTGTKFSINAWRGARPSEPQLPLYAATSAVDGIAIYCLNSDGLEVYGTSARDVGLDFLKGAGAIVDEEPADWSHAVAAWRSAFEALAAEYADGDSRIDRNDPKLAEGEFAMLTRIHSSDERDSQ